MLETIYKTVKYLGKFDMEKISTGIIEIYIQDNSGYRPVLHMISFTYNPRPNDKSENTDFRFWDDEQWYKPIKAYYEKNRLNPDYAKIVTVGFYFLLDDDYLVMYELEWTSIYTVQGFNRLINAPLRDGPVSDVYLKKEEAETIRDIDSALKMFHKTWSRARYGSEEGISSLPLILRESGRSDLIDRHCKHVY